MAQGKTKDLVALTSVPLIMVLGNSMLIPVLPSIKSALDLSQFQVSLIITVFSLTAGLIIPMAGFLSDRLSRKAIIVPSLLLYGGGGLLAGLAALWMSENAYPLIMAGRAIQGLGAAGTAPIAMALLGDLFKGGAQSRALGLSEASNGLGKVLSPIAGSLLGMISWYAAFFAFPALCLLSAAMVWLMVKEPKGKEKRKTVQEYLSSIGKVFKREGSWLISAFLAGSAGLFILFGVLFYLSDLLETRYHIDGVPKGGILAIPLLAMVTTSYTTGALIKKKGKLMKLLIILGLLLLGGSLALAIPIHNIYLLVGLFTLGSIGTGMVLPCLNSFITGAVARSERGMITSIYGSVRFLGVAAGPPVFGWLMGISRTTMLLTVAILAAGAALLALLMIHPEKKGNKSGQEEGSQVRRRPRSPAYAPLFPGHLNARKARSKIKP